MDFNATIDLIIKDLEEAREIIDDLKKYPGVPLLQVEFAKSKCKSAAEVIALLKSIKESQPSSVTEPVKLATPVRETEKIRQEQLQDAETASVTANEVVEITRVEIKKEETEVISATTLIKTTEKETESPEAEIKNNIAEIKKEETEIIIEVPEKPGESKEKLTKPFQGKESTIIADRFSLSARYNEQIGRHDDDFTELIKAKRLSHLSEAIGINDSFLFIREIFNGNKATYSEAIMKLDKAESLKDARAVIMSYTGQNLENEAINQLLDLVKRKLLMHE
jgi:hypothetical protein